MIDILIVGILQAVAGDPSAAPVNPAESSVTSAQEEAAPPAPAEEVVRCRSEPMFGSRARTITRCTTLAQDEETRRQNRREMRRADRGTQPGGESLTPSPF